MVAVTGWDVMDSAVLGGVLTLIAACVWLAILDARRRRHTWWSWGAGRSSAQRLAMASWRDLPAETRDVVLDQASRGQPHGDPEIERIAVSWATAVRSRPWPLAWLVDVTSSFVAFAALFLVFQALGGPSNYGATLLGMAVTLPVITGIRMAIARGKARMVLTAHDGDETSKRAAPLSSNLR